jgi:CHASE2 domain-containing sensor protein
MSAALPDPQPGIPPEVRDAGLAAGMGVVAFLIRALCADRSESKSALAVQTVLAGLVSVLVGMASKGWFTEALGTFHLAVAGMAGFASPELIKRGLKAIKTANIKS